MAHESTRRAKAELELYADILSHDILNNNQAVMSYLELIIATPGVDDKTKKYALKASSQTRMLALMVEDVKKVASGIIAVPSYGRIELRKIVDRAHDEIRNLFPDRKVVLRTTIAPSAASEKADEILGDILVNLLMNAVQLDKAENPKIEVTIEPANVDGERHWKVVVSDDNVILPPMFKKNLAGEVDAKDKSTAVRMSGLAFAKLASETMGGGIRGEEMAKGKSPPGCRFTVSIPRGGGS
jgi:light-regulated signal transduction histidine kinase (bacteriophytochrome)